MKTYDLVIIGGGPAGYVGAIRASQFGLSVALIEGKKVGGTCLNIGCIPTKTFLSYAENIYHMKNSRKGILVDKFNINKEEIYKEKEDVVNKLTGGVEALLKGYGVTLIKDFASFTDNNTIKAGDEILSFKKAIIATGSKSLIPKSLFIEDYTVDSTYVLENPELGKSVIIVGGGVIGCELAFILKSFGMDVTIVEKMPQILINEDKDMTRPIETSFRKKGIKLITGVGVKKIEKGKVILENDKQLISDKCVIAIGRIPNTKNLDPEKAGIKVGEKGEILVNKDFLTHNKNIYAVGDVVGGIQLAHYASAMACKVVAGIAEKDYAPNLDFIPSVTYSIPELATIGMTEKKAKEEGIEYRVGKFMYAANGKALSMGETGGAIKILANKDDKLIGASIVGHGADNLIMPLVVGVSLNLKASDLAKLVYPHPTLSEIILEALEDLHGKAIHKPKRR
jgi:dihydrolipoamide dehydrogenase